MRNLVISITLFLIMIIASSISINYLNRISNNLSKVNKEIEEHINNNNWDKAYNSAIDFSEKWEKQTNVVKLFVNHQELDNIEIELNKLTQFVKEKTADESLASIHTLDFLLKHIINLEKINIQNIF